MKRKDKAWGQPRHDSDVIDERDIANEIDTSLTPQQKANALGDLSIRNRPFVDKFIQGVDAKYHASSTSDLKRIDKILTKASRPEITKKKPWFAVEHIRDALRFRTALNDLRDLPSILQDLRSTGVTIVKCETAKMLKPKAWGWRAVMIDIRLPNGQLAEYYLTPKELMDANNKVHHPLYELWRDREIETLSKSEVIEYQRALEKSNDAFCQAWKYYLERTGQTVESVSAVLEKLIESK